MSLQVPPLQADSVHVFYCRTAAQDAASAALLPVLDDAERAAAARLRLAHARQSYVHAHALCRLMLSCYAPVAPSQWHFAAAAQGKPYIVNHLAQPLHFSLSHTRGLVACAVAHTAVGVDVEASERGERLHDLVATQLTEREARAAALAPDFGRFFLQRWCLKEAYLKACG
ncbi:MAG: 4'-phosphopantetheinyl transferase superfamily protein, partial [Deltaproteobacteria bacterium]